MLGERISTASYMLVQPAWARLPLTPELRAAKAAREQALQRAPLIRRSQAALYQARAVMNH